MFKKISSKQEPIAVVGLGYVGMPLAVEFAKKIDVIGFDVNEEKIKKYKMGIDVTDEVGDEALKNSTIHFTSNPDELNNIKVFIVAVPTPVSTDKTPDLTPVVSASELVGKSLSRGSIVIYESTVYPGTTEDICVPILESCSGLKFGTDFQVGYSPERINPSDKVNTLKTIKKIVSASSKESLDTVAKLYEMVVEAGVHRADSIKVAEAAKVIENSQRDINIAFMNEVSIVLDIMNINTKDVIDAMNTKWNALGFSPGLVGGHCIGVDPYYFIYKSEQLGYHSQIIAAGRKVNDDMAPFAANRIVKKMILSDIKVKNARVAVMGITFKENCPDVRNSKVVDVIQGFLSYGINVFVYDPVCDPDEVKHEYGIDLCSKEELKDMDTVVLAVPHKKFIVDIEEYTQMYKTGINGVFADIKGVYKPKEVSDHGLVYWSL